MAPVRIIPKTSDSKNWKARAEEARLLAETFNDPDSRQIMQGIADSYDLLAKTTEHMAVQRRKVMGMTIH